VNKVIEKKRDTLQIEDLKRIKGIGTVKAIQIVSAFELAKRYFIMDAVVIESVGDILKQVKEYRDKKQEYLIGITLD
jgi:DNA repair protein RadC